MHKLLASRPGHALRRMLATLPEHTRLPFLAWLEQTARRDADLEVLREVKAARKPTEAIVDDSAVSLWKDTIESICLELQEAGYVEHAFDDMPDHSLTISFIPSHEPRDGN